MTYKELNRLCKDKSLPITAKNEDGENIIIERGCDKWSYGSDHWERNFFKIVTAQHNGWTRINFIYEDGTTEELYQR